MPKIAYLVRHAAPERNSHLRYDVAPGPSLAPDGYIQARHTAQFLADKEIRRLYHSPLQRALETAAVIARHLGQPSWESEALREWERGTPAADIRQRMVAFWQTVMENGKGEGAAAFISHGGPIEQLLRHLTQDTLDLSGHRYFGGATTPLGGVWQLTQTNDIWQITLIFNPGDPA